MSKLQVGDPIPDFRLLDDQGEHVDASELRDGRPSVVYFYPKDDTPGCTLEACSFRDQFEAFTDAGARVMGVSSDAPETHRQFKERHRLPFKLLSDPGGHVARAFGVQKLMGLVPGRVTFVLDGAGHVRHRFSSAFNAARHVKEALEVVVELKRTPEG